MNNTTQSTTREQWLADRMQSIGASEAAAALGVSPWKSEFALWAEKTGNAEPDDLSQNEAVEFGIRLEKPVAEAFADRTGRNVTMWPAFQVLRHPDYGWLSCTPDATQVCPERGTGTVQIKTASAYKSADWAEEPPLYYQIQCQTELAVTGHAWGSLVVLIGGQRLRYFDFERNDRFIDAMIPRLRAFWQRVIDRDPPGVDGSEATAKVLAKLHPNDSGEVVVLPPEAQDWTYHRDQAIAAIKQAEETKTLVENKIKAVLGDATYGLLPDGSRWSWKTQTRKSYVVQESTFRALRKLK